MKKLFLLLSLIFETNFCFSQATEYFPANTLDENFFKIRAKSVGGFYIGMTQKEVLAEAKKRRLTAIFHNVSNEYTDYILPSVSIYDGFDCTGELLLQLTIWGEKQQVRYIDVRSGRFTTPVLNRPGMSITEFVKHNKLKNPVLNGTDMMPWNGETIVVPSASFQYYFTHFDDRKDTLLKDGYEHGMPNNFRFDGYLVFIRVE